MSNLTSKINQWDQKVLLKYNGFGGKPFTYFLKFLAFFGRETIWLFFIALFMFIWYDPVLYVYIGATFMGGLILILPLKEGLKRPRPFKTLEGRLEVLEREPTSRSFPSWHAYNVASQALVFGFLLESWLITILLLIFAVLVSFSRIQLGVHYPSDVIVGYILGICGFYLTFFLFAPLFLALISYLEQFAIYPIQYQRVNSMIFEEIWYFTLCIAIFGGIVLSATFKLIKEHLNKKSP